MSNVRLSTESPSTMAGSCLVDEVLPRRDSRLGESRVSGQLSCLVLACNSKLREWSDVAATEAGWEVTLFRDAEAALAAVNSHRFGLAVLELQRPTQFAPAVIREITRVIHQSAGLIIACGQEDDMQGEIQARQWGVWSYLPGLGSLGGLTAICQDAATLASRYFGKVPDAPPSHRIGSHFAPPASRTQAFHGKPPFFCPSR